MQDARAAAPSAVHTSPDVRDVHAGEPAVGGRRRFLAAALASGVLAASGCQTIALPEISLGGKSGVSPGEVRKRSFTTHDGTRLSYLEAGRGRPVVMIPGWSQTAAMFSEQILALSAHYRVIAVDMRGHGDSAKPAHGYRVARLAADLHELLNGLGLEKVTLMGHSMGCAVIWSHWDLFGSQRIHSLILIDQAPCTTYGPQWTDSEKSEAGAVFSAQSLHETAAALAAPGGDRVTAGLINDMFFTKSFPGSKLKYVLGENLKFPRESAAALLIDHASQDWRDTIPRIDVPTLVVGGEASFFAPKSQRWIASQIRGAKVEIFGADEGGGHFMFLENAAKFNRIALDFLTKA